MKIPGIHYEYRDFLTFLHCLQQDDFEFWANFGPIGQKTCFFGSPSGITGRIFLPFSEAEHQRYTPMLLPYFLR